MKLLNPVSLHYKANKPTTRFNINNGAHTTNMFKYGKVSWIIRVYGIFPRFLIILKDSKQALEVIFAHDRSRDESVKSFVCDAGIFVFTLFSIYENTRKKGE
jgi:hypothetical protein